VNFIKNIKKILIIVLPALILGFYASQAFSSMSTNQSATLFIMNASNSTILLTDPNGNSMGTTIYPYSNPGATGITMPQMLPGDPPITYSVITASSVGNPISFTLTITPNTQTVPAHNDSNAGGFGKHRLVTLLG